MRSGDPGPDLPCRMLRVGPDLLFTSQEACQQRSPAVEGQPQDAVGLDATHHQLGGDHRTSSLSYFARVSGFGAKPSAASAVGYRSATA